jgi:hypothetical protein
MAIPISFWDVRTPEMEANSWDEYSIVFLDKAELAIFTE